MIPSRYTQFETPPSILLLAPYCDPDDVGEAYCAFHWVKAIASRSNVTLLTMTRPGNRIHEALPNVQVQSIDEPPIYRRHERLNAMAKLSYPTFYRWAKKVIGQKLKAGDLFDLAHQLSPFSMRHLSPLRHFDIPYVLGPMAGGLPTPNGFKSECQGEAWYMKLRGIDPIRRRIDPALRDSFKKASLILGAAPYVQDLLAGMPIKAFASISELGMDRLPTPINERRRRSHKPTVDQPLRLLHVGRGIRTKGLADVLAAFEKIPDTLHVHLDIAGKGPEIDKAADSILEKGLMDRVTLHGQIPRSHVEQLYAAADVFCFPSFREPSGSVVFEALSHGMPVITADAGGPAHVIDASCGLKVPVTTPDDMAKHIAGAIETLYHQPNLREYLSLGAVSRMRKLALWPNKMDQLFDFYTSLLPQKSRQLDGSAYQIMQHAQAQGGTQ